MPHAATGPAPRRPAARWSAITTSRAAVRRRPHGTPRTVREAARSRISSPRAETDTSTASRTDATSRRPCAKAMGRLAPLVLFGQDELLNAPVFRLQWRHFSDVQIPLRIGGHVVE